MKKSFKTRWYDSLPSTQDEAKRLIGELDDMETVAAGFQSAGRGQRGNSWVGTPWENLTFSTVLKLDSGRLEARNQFQISLAATLAVQSLLTLNGIVSRIKWPNDVYVGDRKICGMLIENSLKDGYVDWSIVGIGLNVNQKQFPQELVNPCSMSMVSGTCYDVKEELDKFLEIFKQYYPLVGREERQLRQEYYRHMYRIAEIHHYVDCASGESFRGCIAGIAPDGRLIIRLQDGSERLYAFKEVSYVI